MPTAIDLKSGAPTLWPKTEMPARARPKSFWPKLAWPAGTTYFIVKTWIALAIGFYLSFVFELDGASSCGISILILAQPTQGMILSKAIYRTAGTLVGVVAALIISSAFPQDEVMLLASFALWIGLLTAVATLLRDFRAYGCVLAGYTVGIISIVNIDTPDATFDAAVNRVAAILVGIAAITLANLLLSTGEASGSLLRKLESATHDVIDLAEKSIAAKRRLDPELFVDLAARLMPLRSEISFATPEKPNAWERAAGGRSALLALLEALTAIEAVGAGLSQMETPTPLVTQALGLTQKAMHLENPEEILTDFDRLALEALPTGGLDLTDAHILDRLHFLIVTMAEIRDGLCALRNGTTPRRFVRLPVHQDYVAVVLNATRVIVSIGIVATLSIWSGLPQTAMAVLLTAVFVALGSLLPNPDKMGTAGLYGMPIVIVLSAIYSFFIFPNIAGYPLFIVSLAPLIILMCWLIMIGQPGYGMIIGVITMTQAAPANLQAIDPDSFVASAIMLIPSGLAIFMAFRLVIPVQPAQRRIRLALAVGKTLRHALVDKGHYVQPRASLHYDRLSQFKTWQRNQPVTLARRKTMQRLIDLGLLSYALRRSWRALDRTKSLVAPELDRKAREILPTLSPKETDELAQLYLSRASEQSGASALALIHAAAALHGTALVTHSEMRLLQRVELFHRMR